MPQLPRITVVTPSFDQARFLDATLRSILDQDYPDLEVIVMDGGSMDGSREIIERHAPQLSHWQSEPDAGQAAAIQAGFARATGEVLLWVNSDDLLLPDALDAVGRFFAAHPQETFVVGHAIQIDAAGAAQRRFYATPPTFGSLVFGGGNPAFAQPSAAWRKSAYEQAGGVDPDLHFAMDLDLYVRLTLLRPGALLERFTSAYRFHPDTKTSRLDDVRREEVERIVVTHGRDRASALKRAWLRRWYRRRRRWYRRRGRRRWHDAEPERALERYALAGDS